MSLPSLVPETSATATGPTNGQAIIDWGRETAIVAGDVATGPNADESRACLEERPGHRALLARHTGRRARTGGWVDDVGYPGGAAVSKSRWVCLAGLALLLSTAAVYWQEADPAWQVWPTNHNAQPGATSVPVHVQALVPTQTGKAELCVVCHVGIEDISPSHSAQAIGCAVCHGGEPLALDADIAHATLRGGRNPSDPSVAALSCGQAGCHSGYANEEQNHVDRVAKSLMATYAGGIALVRFTFGAQSSLTAQYGVSAQKDLGQPLPVGALTSLEQLPASDALHLVDQRLQANCLSSGCHLSSPPWPQPYYYRSTGCAACHVYYGNDGLYRGSDPTVPRDQPGHGQAHRLTTAIPFCQCNHCHNRGNYSLKQMAFLPREDLPPVAPTPTTLVAAEVHRWRECYQPIGDVTKCEIELDCIDCHTSAETMGDGHIYGNKHDLLDVQCRTCHGTLTAPPSVATVQDPDGLALRQARLNGRTDFLGLGDKVLLTGRGGPLWSVKQTAATEFVQVGKVTGKTYSVPLVLGSECLQDGRTQKSEYCHQCHVADRG